MEDIEQELEAKSIERDSVEIKEVEEPQPGQETVTETVTETKPVKKVKKPRSEKQIAAFEKARLKRAEGIAARKKQKEETKLQKKEEKKELKKEVQAPSVQENNIPKPVVNTTPSMGSSSHSREQNAHQLRHQVKVNLKKKIMSN